MSTITENASSGAEKKAATSRDHAKCLRELADWLDSRPEFEVPYFDRLAWLGFAYYEKDQFLAAVKALGTGKKEFGHNEIKFVVETPFARVSVSAPRDKVCRLIRPAEYECDPFFSEKELAEIDGAA